MTASESRGIDRFGRSYPLIMTCAWFALTGCGGGGGGGGGGAPTPPAELASDVILNRHRDPATGQVAPVLQPGSGFEAQEVDSPAVLKDSARPNLDKYMMFYEATSTSGVSTIGLVSSDEEDFATVTRRTQVIGLGAVGSGYESGATDPTVVVDPLVSYGNLGRYKMWFEGRSGPNGEFSSIIYATSGSGENWTIVGPCFGLEAYYASVRIADPCVIIDGALYRMWFEGVNSQDAAAADGPGVIGYAQSTDGQNWTVLDSLGQAGLNAEPVFMPGDSGGFDGYSVSSPTVLIDPTAPAASFGRYKLFYEAIDTATQRQSTIGFAQSADGWAWSDPVLPAVVPSSDSIDPLPFDSGDLEHPTALIDDQFLPTDEGFVLLWYTGDGENGASGNQIGLSRGFLP